MSVSLRENSSSLARASFVRRGEEVAVSRKRKGEVNTADGAAAFTAEESTSFYGNLVGLPSNVRLRRAPSGGTSTWGLDSSYRLNEAAGYDGVHREPSGSVASANLSESNIGFQLLKKSGWKEGTGLGATEQGRLDPVETHLKQDRRGIGADLKKSKSILSSEERRSQRKALKETEDGKKEKVLSKKARKALAKAEREQEQALAAAFYREFWPENV